MSARRQAIMNLSCHGLGKVRMCGPAAVTVGREVMPLQEYRKLLYSLDPELFPLLDALHNPANIPEAWV